MNSKFFIPLNGETEHPLRSQYLRTQSEYPSLRCEDGDHHHQNYVQCIKIRDKMIGDGLAVPIWLTLRIEALTMMTAAERLYKSSFRLEDAYLLAHYPDEQRFEEECVVDQETGARLPLSTYVALPDRSSSPSFQPTYEYTGIRSGPSSSVRVTAPQQIIVITSGSSAPASPDLRTPPSSAAEIGLRVPLPDNLVLDDIDTEEAEISQHSGRCSPTQHVSQLPVDSSDEDSGDRYIRVNTPPIEILTTDEEAWIVKPRKSGKKIVRTKNLGQIYSPY